MKKVILKYLSYLTISFTITFSVHAQVIPTQKNKLWGAVTANGIIKIPLKYKSVDFYNNYLLVTNNNNKKGLFTLDGISILKTEFDAILPIKQNYFQVYNNGKTGIVNAGNKTIIPIAYESIIYDTENNYFIVSKQNKYGVLDENNTEIIPLQYDNIALYNNKFYLFKKGKQFAITKTLKNINILHYFDDLVVISENIALVKKENLWGLENLEGKTILPTNYEIIKPFGKKYFLVKTEKKFGIFNSNGKQITPFAYNKPFYNLQNNVIWTKKEGAWTSVNLANFKEKTLDFEKLLDTTKNFFRVIKNNRVILINKKEEILFLENEFQDIIPINDSIFKVLKKRKWGIISKTNQPIIPIKYDKIEIVKNPQKDIVLNLRYDIKIDTVQNMKQPHYFIVENNAKKGIITFSGKEISKPIYDNIQWQNGVFITTINHQKGAINKNGVELLKPKYTKIQCSKFDKALVYQKKDSTRVKFPNKKPILLNKEVSFVAWSSKKGQFFASKNKVKGAINANNQISIPFTYKRLYDLDKNYSIGITNSGAQLINKQGKLVHTNYYSSIKIQYYKDKALFLVSKNLKNGVINSNGFFVIPLGNYQLKFTKQMLFRAENNKGKLLGYFDASGKKYW